MAANRCSPAGPFRQPLSSRCANVKHMASSISINILEQLGLTLLEEENARGSGRTPVIRVAQLWSHSATSHQFVTGSSDWELAEFLGDGARSMEEALFRWSMKARRDRCESRADAMTVSIEGELIPWHLKPDGKEDWPWRERELRRTVFAVSPEAQVSPMKCGGALTASSGNGRSPPSVRPSVSR